MHIERAELLVTLKADKTWKKGTIFDPKKDGHPIPPAVIAEVRAKTGAVRVLGPVGVEPREKITEAPPITTLAKLKEKYPGLVSELTAEIGAELQEAQVLHAEATDLHETPLTGSDIRSMSRERILELLENEEDFESLKIEKRIVLVGIAVKRFVKNDQS